MISPLEAQTLYDQCVSQHHPILITPLSLDQYTVPLIAHECTPCKRLWYFDQIGEIMMFATFEDKEQKAEK